MPVSKRRKPTTRKRRVPVSPVKSTRWRITLNGSRLPFIKNDPDFLTLIKIGRAMNAVLFGVTGMIQHSAESTVLDTRQYRRSIFVLGGYLHQSINLVLSIKGRYLTDPAFEPLRLLVLDSEHKKTRDYVRKIRNFTAFHLDEFDATTRKTLANMKPETCGLLAGDDNTVGGFYFELSDILDMQFLIDTFADGRERTETAADIINSMMELASKFLEACHTFQQALCERTNIKEHVYR